MRALALTLAALAAAGCVGGPAVETPPLLDPRLTEHAVEGAATLTLSRWGPEAPVATILALHGYGDYGPSAFRAAAEAWAEAGIETLAYDQRGFGRNSDNGRWPGAERLIEDAVAIARAAQARRPETPLFLLGHSMGGGVALAAVGAGAEVDGLILAAPAVWGGESLSLPYRALAWAGAALFPDKRWTGEGVVRIQASDNIEALRALGRDPLVIGAPSSRDFMGLIRVMDRAVAAAPEAEAPILALYGAKDQVTPQEPLEALLPRLGGETRYVVYPEGWHLLFRDLQAERVWADVADWVRAEAMKVGS